MEDDQVHPDALEQMRSSYYNFEETRWAAYRNMALDSHSAGHIQYLAIGPKNTFTEKTDRCPDSPSGFGWKYLFFGWVNLETGRIEEDDGKSSSSP